MAVKNKRRIKGLLAERGIAQVDLAKTMRMSVVTINAKVNNVEKFKLDELYNLAEAFDMTLVELIQYLEN